MINKKLIITSAITASILTTYAFSNQNTLNIQTKPQSHTIEFEEVSVPTREDDKKRVRASSFVTIDGKKYNIGFHTILRSGDKIGNGIFGMIFDNKGQALYSKNGSVRVSNSNDFSSLISVGNKLFMLSQFETRPAAMYLTELEQTANGHLKAVNTKNIDFSSVKGLWVPCAGSVTPWNSHLGSEEYEPNAAKVKENGSIDSYYAAMADYFGGDLKALNPYDYGWIPEVKVLNEKGNVKIAKHYSMGRFSHELAYVMPDEKTVFLSDDGINVALFMFIADEKRNLSSGKLYAAKWEQRGNKGAGQANIKWIDLGHSSNARVKTALDKKIKFTDIFEKVSANKHMTCPTGFSSINTTMNHECLKIKPNIDELASRMETRRFAAIKGATTEFNKMEGITYNSNDNILYLAMSAIARGMENYTNKGKATSKYDGGGKNNIKLKYNPCGAVYAMNMISFSTPTDTNGKIINSKFVPNNMYSIIEGWQDNSIAENKCSVKSLANPDNITYIQNTKTLIIGEDTSSGHQNDYIWSYNLENKNLTRIQTTPYGSETTSPYYYNNIGGYGYLMSVIQHPYGEGDATTKTKDMPSKAKTLDDIRAYTGYIGPLPVISK